MNGVHFHEMVIQVLVFIKVLFIHDQPVQIFTAIYKW